MYTIMKKQYYFNFEEILSFAWTKTKQHAWFLFCTAVMYALAISASMDVIGIKILGPFGYLICGFVGLSLLSISLTIVRNEAFTFGDLTNRLRSPKLVINFFILTAIYAAAIVIFFVPFIAAYGIMLANLALGIAISGKFLWVLIASTIFLLPGIFITIRFKFYPYVLLENEHFSLTDVIKHSYNLTCCVFWNLLWFLIILSVINILGFLAFGVGLIITIPVSVFSLAHLYRQLETHSH